MLKIDNVSKRFGSIRALEGVSFDINDGEFVFITGPSGAGKSTLLSLILRQFVPDTGEIIFDGIRLNSLKKSQVPRLRQKIGVVFQDFKVLPERTVRENVEVSLAVLGVNPNEWRKRTDEVLALVGLGKRTELFPAQLSGGEVQRVSIARALVVDPILVLADEPTGNLDWKTAGAIMEIFDKINKEGKTVIVATHHQGIVDKLGKRVITIDDGKLVGDSLHVKTQEKK